MARVSAETAHFDCDAIVFDKDGTLIELDYMWAGRAERWAAALRAARPRFSTAALYRAIAYDRRRRRAVPDGPLAVASVATLAALAAGVLYRQEPGWHAAEHLAQQTAAEILAALPTADEVRPIGAVAQTLTQLAAAGIKLAVVTTDSRDATLVALDALGIAPLLGAVACGDDPGPRKPDPAVLTLVCGHLGVAPARTLIVGDSLADLLTGRRAGLVGSIGLAGEPDHVASLRPAADAVIAAVDQIVVISPSHTP